MFIKKLKLIEKNRIIVLYKLTNGQLKPFIQEYFTDYSKMCHVI